MFSKSSNDALRAHTASKRYDIKEAAHYLDVAPSTLRYWESEGLVRSERNPENDYRQYSLHSLIDASEIAFYRQLGVPVKELKHYRDFTADALDDALGRTEQRIEARMAELAAAQSRLARQRDLNACAETLRATGMHASSPPSVRVVEIDYANPAHWLLLVDEPWRYGLFIDAANPDAVQEGIIEEAASTMNAYSPDSHPHAPSGQNHPEPACATTIWSANSLDGGSVCLECLLRVDPYSDVSNARDILAEALQHAVLPDAIVATYIVTAAEYHDGPRWDLYRAWIVGSPIDEPMRASSIPPNG